MSTIINTPEGSRDRLFDECTERRRVQDTLTELFSGRGYTEVSTPEMEYYDLFVQTGTLLPQESFVKVVDRSGKLLVMRPDCTVPIARMAATKLKSVPLPQKFYYNETVFRSGLANKGGNYEFSQCGVEVIGAGGTESDIDVIALAIDAMRAVSPGPFHIELGHAGLFRALAEELKLSAGEAERLGRLFEGKQFAALNQALEPYRDEPAYAMLSRLSRLFGGPEVLDEAEELAGKRPKLEELRRIWEGLRDRGYGDYIRFDLGLVQQLHYYTGVIFRGYVEGAGAPVLSGGRYDLLMEQFGRSAPAAGFAVDVDAVADISIRPHVQEDTHRLRLAVTKGRLQEDSVKLFEDAGLDCTPLRDPGRRLVHELPDYPLDVVLAKAPDVITYVEHGVCDLGIVGKDTIMEMGSGFYEVLDLGLGKCRFCLCVKEGTDFYGTYKRRCIASKYPQVTREFFAGKGMDVDIIKIEGSAELAPILGLADAIVDIVETGNTLRENGLVAIEDVAQISARLIVNTASMKLYRDEILDFIGKIELVLEKRSGSGQD
ncbi:MAG: ATP phosphoribosyltransferase regulatory subunit [Oscillospiraceae bacterium]|nr:ATP phosphoribosyltransferase regulatory subunit [Oscillospiraceae bacterium]